MAKTRHLSDLICKQNVQVSNIKSNDGAEADGACTV